MIWYDINYGFYHFFSSLKNYFLICIGILWVVSITLFWRIYTIIHCKEYFDPYLLNLNKERKQFCSRYMLVFFVIILFLLNHIFLSMPLYKGVFSYPLLIFSIILILWFIISPFYQDKIMHIFKKNKVRSGASLTICKGHMYYMNINFSA